MDIHTYITYVQINITYMYIIYTFIHSFIRSFIHTYWYMYVHTYLHTVSIQRLYFQNSEHSTAHERLQLQMLQTSPSERF